MKKLCLSIAVLVFVVSNATAQTKNPVYEEYISKYSKAAQEQQTKYGIPASITLAQGLLESAAGKSELTQKSNNHFGIKCTSDWQGATTSHDDDKTGECFRVYKKAEQSFEDHSLFLKRPRYQKLFTLPSTDYKGWAHGLKQCGYATDPQYANKLIKLIEDYELHRFDVADVSVEEEEKIEKQEALKNDEIGKSEEPKAKSKKAKMKPIDLYQEHKLYRHNGRKYIIANAGETFAGLAYEYNISERRLRRFNDADDRRELRAGDRVYLYRKRARAMQHEAYYRVKRGDTAWSIAQNKGIRLKTIYKLNGIEEGQEVTINQQLKLR
ncbi:MAG: glucosaminidase domain-containing protein [Paludibacteraceae bacterium]|nr:glucosaminidase domain-containing protein [Paludibacteraceae bacterium]